MVKEKKQKEKETKICTKIHSQNFTHPFTSRICAGKPATTNKKKSGYKTWKVANQNCQIDERLMRQRQTKKNNLSPL
jgi:hypothetical protein